MATDSSALSASATLPASAAAVTELFCSEDFIRQVSEAAGGTLESFERHGETNSAFDVQITRSVPSDRLPDFARKIIGSKLSVKQRESWSAPQADASRTVEIQISVAGAPVQAKATQTLTEAGDETLISITGSVTSSIPFLGAKIAQAAEPIFAKALKLQIDEARKALGAA